MSLATRAGAFPTVSGGYVEAFTIAGALCFVAATGGAPRGVRPAEVESGALAEVPPNIKSILNVLTFVTEVV
jgi:hypothetical protein